MPQSVNLDLSLFENVNLVDATLNVPAGTKALYQAHEVWGQFGTIIETSTGGADGISNIANTLPEISLSDRILTVFSPAAEQIYVYSLTGAMLYNASKFSGVVTFNISHLSQGVLIIKGNSGWTQKVILK
jgi:hypothetical protein